MYQPRTLIVLEQILQQPQRTQRYGQPSQQTQQQGPRPTTPKLWQQRRDAAWTAAGGSNPPTTLARYSRPTSQQVDAAKQRSEQLRQQQLRQQQQRQQQWQQQQRQQRQFPVGVPT